jgi:hypothetical protein
MLSKVQVRFTHSHGSASWRTPAVLLLFVSLVKRSPSSENRIFLFVIYFLKQEGLFPTQYLSCSFQLLTNEVLSPNLFSIFLALAKEGLYKLLENFLKYG